MKNWMLYALAILLALVVVTVPASADNGRHRSNRNDESRRGHSNNRGQSYNRGGSHHSGRSYYKHSSRYNRGYRYGQGRPFYVAPWYFDVRARRDYYEPSNYEPTYLPLVNVELPDRSRPDVRETQEVGENPSECYDRTFGRFGNHEQALELCKPGSRTAAVQDKTAVAANVVVNYTLDQSQPAKKITSVCVRGELLCNGTAYDANVYVDDQFVGTLRAGRAGPLASFPGWKPGAKINYPVCQ